nr:hypothetical protein Iba_scaffold24013CG0260 [Ipomoea batatas]
MEASRWTSNQERKRQAVQQGRVNGARGSDGSGGGVGHHRGPRPLPGSEVGVQNMLDYIQKLRPLRPLDGSEEPAIELLQYAHTDENREIQ